MMYHWTWTAAFSRDYPSSRTCHCAQNPDARRIIEGSGFLASLVTNPLFRWMENVLAQRANKRTLLSRVWVVGFSSLSSCTVFLAARFARPGDRHPGACGIVEDFDGSLLVGTGWLEPTWWGGGYGLGPSRHRGYGHDDNSCLAFQYVSMLLCPQLTR